MNPRFLSGSQITILISAIFAHSAEVQTQKLDRILILVSGKVQFCIPPNRLELPIDLKAVKSVFQGVLLLIKCPISVHMLIGCFYCEY